MYSIFHKVDFDRMLNIDKVPEIKMFVIVSFMIFLDLHVQII